MTNVEEELEKFAVNVITTAKQNLKREGKAGGNLEKMPYELEVGKNSFSLGIDLADYWEFVDRGVKGVGGTKADGSKWKLKKVVNSPFKYRNERPPVSAFDKWTIRKGKAPRRNKGTFKKRSSLKYALAESVYHTGLETTFFFTAPFEKEFRKLPDELVEAYALDIDNFLEFVTKK